MKLILSLLVLCIISYGHSTLLGARECTYGPSYWCESIPNAKQCNAVKHCIQTVWEKKILPEDKGEVCSICKVMITDARDQLRNRDTQDAVRKVFEGSCKLIPVTTVRDECIKFSDEYIPEFMETLASEMNPQVVCATVGLCNSVTVDRLLKKYKNVTEAVLPQADCQDCTTFVQDVIINIERHPQQYLFNHLIAICDRLSSLSDGCRILIESNLKSIYKFITTELKPKDVCDLFGMCERMYGNEITPFRRDGDEPCDFCVSVVSSWRKNLVSNFTKDEFRMILEGICHQTGQFEQECLSLVDNYFEVLYDVLVSQIHPKQVCEAVGLCGAHSIFNTPQTPYWPLFEMRPENHLFMAGSRRPSFSPGRFTGNDEANSFRRRPFMPRIPLLRPIIGNDEAKSYRRMPFLPRVSLSRPIFDTSVVRKASIPSSKVHGQNECVMCEFVLHFLQNMLDDKKTRDEIRHELDLVCTYMPKSIVEECQDYVDAYSDNLIQYIILEIDPSMICPAIHLCPGKLNVEEDPSCVLCEFVMVQLDNLLKNKSTEEEIKAAIDQVCTLMPKSIKDSCKTFIDLYIDQLVDLLVNDYTPRQICAQIKLCPDKESHSLPNPSQAQLPISRLFVPVADRNGIEDGSVSVHQSTTCVLCEFIMSRLDALILKNSTEQNIKNLLEKVCTVLPHSLVTDCLAFMEQYYDSILQLLVNDLNPEMVCKELALCKSIPVSDLPKAVVQMPVDRCDVCHRIAVLFSSKPSIDQNSADFELKLRNLCPEIGSKDEQKVCMEIANEYGQYLPRLWGVLKNTEDVCQSIKQCPLEEADLQFIP